MLGDKYAAHAIVALAHYEIQSNLEAPICRTQAQLALETIKKNVVNARLIECLDHLIARIEGTGKCVLDSGFKKLSSSFINWN